ncbi:hypothetical protein CBS101457_001273 [Exobasidium rhododendri]|nr:hypothetical protein CBS101457_001273 [Exobasidium rhododendri]
MSSSKPQRRRRDRREDEVDASQGKLGPDFDEEKLQRDGGGAMTISEARQLLVRAVNQEKEEAAGTRDAMQNPVFKKCFEYCEMFSKYKDEDMVRKVREELQEYGVLDQVDDEGNAIPPDDDHMRLSRFEMAQLANLNCEDVEEAKVLIPTLAPKDETQLATLLNELATKRKFQT